MSTWLLILQLWSGRIEAYSTIYATEQACLAARHPMDVREGQLTCEEQHYGE